MSNLQLFLGIDKNNPLFSIYSYENNPELLACFKKWLKIVDNFLRRIP